MSEMNEKIRYAETCWVEEDHQIQIFGVSFFRYGKECNVFATVGGNRASIYQCLPLSNKKSKSKNKNINEQLIELLQCYIDEAWDESFYALCWSKDKSNASPLLCIAGALGVIKVINCNNETLKQV